MIGEECEIVGAWAAGKCAISHEYSYNNAPEIFFLIFELIFRASRWLYVIGTIIFCGLPLKSIKSTFFENSFHFTFRYFEKKPFQSQPLRFRDSDHDLSTLSPCRKELLPRLQLMSIWIAHNHLNSLRLTYYRFIFNFCFLSSWN